MKKLCLAFAAALPFQAGPEERREPKPFEARGRIVCLLEEFKSLYQADVVPIHEHAWGLRVSEPGALGYFTILRTRAAEGLFADPRLRNRELACTGRIFPASAIVEVSRYRSFKNGRLCDVYYWCEICAIRSQDPGPCACCQGKVELKEVPEGH